MSFGLYNVLTTFKRMMDMLLHSSKWSNCLCYLDVVIVLSLIFATHFTHLLSILSVFRGARLQLNCSKCHLRECQISILGHLVNSSGVCLDPAKVHLSWSFLYQPVSKMFEALWDHAHISADLSRILPIH